MSAAVTFAHPACQRPPAWARRPPRAPQYRRQLLPGADQEQIRDSEWGSSECSRYVRANAPSYAAARRGPQKRLMALRQIAGQKWQRAAVRR